MQIAGPHPQHFRVLRCGVGPENVHFPKVSGGETDAAGPHIGGPLGLPGLQFPSQ